MIFKILSMPRLKETKTGWTPKLKRGQWDYNIPPHEREREYWHYHNLHGPRFWDFNY
jgi:hypothetical protein